MRSHVKWVSGFEKNISVSLPWQMELEPGLLNATNV